MKTPDEFLKENSPLLPSEKVEGTGYLHTAEVYKAMEMYRDYAVSIVAKNARIVFDEKEAECQSLREQIREMMDRM